MNGLVLCAGKGRRMQPISNTLPKPILPYKNFPIFLYNIRSLLSLDLDNVGIVISPGAQKIFETILLDFGYSDQVDIFYQSEFGGIIRAIQCAKDYTDQSIIVCAGDTAFRPSDCFQVEYLSDDADIVVSAILRSKEEILRRSNIILKEDTNIVRKTIEKPNPEEIQSEWAGSPLWAFSTKMWDYFDEGNPVGGEIVVQSVVDIALERGDKVLAAKISKCEDLTFPKDVAIKNSTYLQNLLTKLEM